MGRTFIWSYLGKFSQILHHISVQESILKDLDGYKEVIWDRNIVFPDDKVDRPDALLLSKSNYWIAFEYEKWRKDRKRIYLSFFNHANSLIKKRYSAVFYSFDNDVDRKFYQGLFDESDWPRIKREKSGKLRKSSLTFSPDAIENMRECFKFVS